ncbi:talin-2a isoform X4 [Colossoma macropomum]|uniref:talin-2a isoform X4 n=1 Tax=Colossoma macropomum TaxID=42526 RepID=UPI00186490AF|nr:talin-2a isoform X4 [Colossoma macropomum]
MVVFSLLMIDFHENLKSECSPSGSRMVVLSLKICVRQCNVVKTMQFEPATAVYDACRVIRERVPEAQTGQASEYGLFLSDEDPRKGIWLDGGCTLDYYMLRNGDILEYKKKQRPQKIKMLDGAVKTIMVDDSKTVGELLVTICSRIGITNYEEYSLIQEEVEEKKEEGMGTLRKDRTLLRDDRKMEKLKAKLHTDDELNWLDHGRTFREQGVEESETLLLRRKFFYSDQNVDSRDPVQLNLLYVQARDDILNGSHPVSFDKACEFGGIQTQIQFGPHIEHKHKVGFLDLKEFLPKEYIKQRGAEKKIFQEHKACGEMTEIEAKVKYVKLARSLRTYGVSFFLVKEKMKSKNKLVPRLLGITKESVMRVDEKTKEVLQEWPLTTVKRWAASPKSFTLDFGEYQESYYSVQTTEGEQISQLIAGYIDIILKKKQSKDRFGLEGDEEATMLEESVSPKKSTILQQQFNRVGRAEHGSVALPGVLRTSSVGPETLNVGTMPSPQQQITTGQMHLGHMPPLSAAQQALVGTINTSMQAVQQAQADLEEVEELPPLGNDMASKVWIQNKVDESKHEIHSQVGAITAGTASVVNLTAGDPTDTDYTAVGCAITTISSNLTEMSKGVKLLAALMEDEVGSGQDLMRAARTLTGAVSDLLKAVEPASGEPRQTVLTAAGSIGQASGDLLRQIGENETDERFQDVLMNLAKAVANAAAMMVLKAKNVAQVSEDTVLQNRVIAAATQCALSTSQLVACAKVVSPTISSPVCQEQLIEAGKLVDRSVEGCVKACLSATDDGVLLKAVSAAASVVTQTLADLLTHVRNYASRGEPIGRYDQATDAIMTVTESIFSSMGDAGEMVKQARLLAQATSDLVNAMRSDAEAEIDVNNSKKLLAAAKLLADATARMVEAAKGAAAYPENEDQQQKLREAAEGLRVATNAAAQNAIRKKLITKLENAAKQAAAAATQTIAASQNAAASNKNTAVHQQLVQSCKAVADHIPQLVQGVRNSQGQPEDGSAQLALIIASQNFLQPGSKMVASAKSSVPTVGDQAAAMQLGQCAKNLATSLAELRTAAQKAYEACGSMEIDSALTAVQTLRNELQDAKMAAIKQQLKPLPGESLEKCAQDLGSTSKAVGSSMAQLLTCAAQGNEHYTGVAARETAQALKTLAQAARGVAAATSDPATASAMLDSAREVMDGSTVLISEAKQALVAPGDTESQQRLAQVARSVSHSLSACVNCLPGQKDVDMALKNIGEASKKLLMETIPPCSKSFQEAQSDLNQTAADLNQSAGDVVHASKGTSSQLADASGKFSEDFDEFLDAGIEMAGHTQSKEDQFQVIGNLKNISMASSKLLLAAKSLSVDPGAANAKSLLAAAARSVTDSVNQLINLCTQQVPGQKECDSALRELEAVRGLLDNPNEPVNDLSYFDCIESVMESSKVLGESMAGISHNCKTGDVPAFGDCVAVASKALCGLTEAAGQASYLVGVSDPNSQTGHQGLVDPVQFARANQAIQMACQNLVDPGSSPSQGSAAQEPILQSARSMLDSSTQLLKTARSLVMNPKDPPTWSLLASHSRTVSDSIKSLITAIRDKAPGQRECDSAIDSINKCIRDIERASLAAISQNLPTREDISLEALQEQLMSSVQEVGHLIEPISTAAKGEAAQLGHKVSQLASYFEPLHSAAVGMASKIMHHQQQMNLLDQTKTLAESALQMLYAAKEGGGNPKQATLTHDAIAEATQLMREAVDDLMVTLNEAASEVGIVGGMVDSIADSMGKLGEGTPPEPEGSFVDYQTTMVKYSKAIAVTAQEMMTKSVSAPEELGSLASQVTGDYSQLALQGCLAAATAEPEEIGVQIKMRVQELGHGCLVLVQKAGALQICPSDSITKRELIEYARVVTEKVSMVLSVLQAGNKGTQACITAASAVSGIIADLDTTIMFASASTLNAETDTDSFAEHRENILKTAKALVEDTKNLVSGAASGQEKLARAAQSSAKTITQLTDVVKLGAASIGPDDPETQVVLLNAVKDVAKALAELIGATKCAAGKAADDSSMFQLKSAAKVMVTNVTSLLKTVKAVEDEATRGTRALEATIECIRQELTVFQSKDTPGKFTTPEEFIRMTKGITTATAKAVAAGNSARQEDVISTANLSRKVIADMLTACKQAAYHDGVSEEVRSRALLYGTECTNGYVELLEQVLQVLQRPTAEQKQHLAVFSKRVAGAVTELIQTAEAMKGTEWVDPEDPTVIAETELLGAAASIEAAAKKLEQLKPRAKPKQADESLDFEEQILEAAKSIAAATSALVKSASAAQRELVAQGKVGSIPANAEDDGQWSQGLISAARMVAAATSNLCEAANASVQGHATEEKLISSAKQVAASTAQLLVACKVKADQDSEAMRRLQAAGNAVKRASDNLVKAAQKAAFDKADDENVVVKTKFVGGIAQIIAAQEEMLRKERELEEARKKLAQIRQQQYKFLPSELRGDED